MKINKINDKLDFDVEVQWSCHSYGDCKTKIMTNKAPNVVGGPAVYVCNSKWTGKYKYSTSGWSIF